MKRFIPLLMLCLLLTGCGAEATPTEAATEPVITEAAPAPPEGTYDPFSSMEQETGGAVKAYPLDLQNVRGIRVVGDDVLVFSGGDEETVITQLTGDTLYPEKSFTAGEYLSMGDITFHNSSLSWFSSHSGTVTVMDIPGMLLHNIEVPEDMTGRPVLSPDGSTLYYCTAGLLYAMDLESGISRVLKEISYGQQSVTSTHLGGSILQLTGTDYTGQWRTLYLSAEVGRILREDSGELKLFSGENRYFCNLFEGSFPTHLFGSLNGTPQELFPRCPGALCFYLPGSHAVVTIAYADEKQILDYYDLTSGLRTGSLSFPADFPIRSISENSSGNVCFLCYGDKYLCDVLYDWDPTASPTGDTNRYTADHYTADNPDFSALEECAAYAGALSEKHGLEILVYQDAVATEPENCTLKPEHNAILLRRELERLDKHLENYPEGFLVTLAEHFGGLRICLVSSLEPSQEITCPDASAGIQFWTGQTACIALSVHENTEYALYHQLCHLIDSLVLTESTAYDRWDTLNPKDFAYDDSVSGQQDGSPYLRPGSENFIDTDSMRFPGEDRARIMEHAMTDGNEALFHSRAMQKKLLTLCQGIRDAFGLKKSSETFLWEQYLTTSLAYTE